MTDPYHDQRHWEEAEERLAGEWRQQYDEAVARIEALEKTLAEVRQAEKAAAYRGLTQVRDVVCDSCKIWVDLYRKLEEPT